MFKTSNYPQTGSAPALKPYSAPTVRIAPVSLEAALLKTSSKSEEIIPGMGDDWGDF